MNKTDAKNLLTKCQNDPVFFFENVLGVTTLEAYQKRILRTIAKNRRTAIKACHGVGKSFLMARVVPWFLMSFPGAKIITTAPTYNQVKNILWKELRTAHAKSKIPLGGELNLTEWKIDDERFALGFTTQNETSGSDGQGTQSTFQGFHSENLMIIFDEATGIIKNIWTMGEGLMTSANTFWVAIGNPTATDCEFYKCFHSFEWAKESITCFDSPNFIANGITDLERLRAEVEEFRMLDDEGKRARLKAYKIVRPHLIVLDWAVSKIAKWGFDHPLTLGKILGEFPLQSERSLVSITAIEAAMQRRPAPAASDRRVIGLDVARFGGDDSVLTVLHGPKFLDVKSYSKMGATELSGEVMHAIREWNPDVIVIDETGVGGGVVDILKENQDQGLIAARIEIRGVQFGEGFDDEELKEKYVNQKARMFDLLGHDIKDNLQLGNDDAYLEELPAIRYLYDSKGRLKIESKEEFKKRSGGKSPDKSDSLALANYGRYDEMTSGSFTSDFLNVGRPLTAGIGG